MLSTAFKDMYNVLRDDHYLTVTFHNPTTKVRNSTIRAGTFAGFDFEKIHWQELARPSAKSLLQPFGSAVGDFYLRFVVLYRHLVSPPFVVDFISYLLFFWVSDCAASIAAIIAHPSVFHRLHVRAAL